MRKVDKYIAVDGQVVGLLGGAKEGVYHTFTIEEAHGLAQKLTDSSFELQLAALEARRQVMRQQAENAERGKVGAAGLCGSSGGSGSACAKRRQEEADAEERKDEALWSGLL